MTGLYRPNVGNRDTGRHNRLHNRRQTDPAAKESSGSRAER
jgi:hypothetical protein